jgi:hypothetical protein
MQEIFVVYLLFWGWSAAESSLTKLFLVYYTCSSLCTNPSTEPWLCLPASVAACNLGPVYEHSLPGGCLQLQVMKCHVTLGLESMYLSLLFLRLAWVIRKCCIYPTQKLHASFCFLLLGSGVSWGWVICPSGSSNWVLTLCELVGIRGISSELELQSPGEPIYMTYSIFHLFRMLNEFCFLELVLIFWKLIYNFQIPSEHLFFSSVWNSIRLFTWLINGSCVKLYDYPHDQENLNWIARYMETSLLVSPFYLHFSFL